MVRSFFCLNFRRPVTSAAPAPQSYLTVMLQVGETQQIPVNIPTEVIAGAIMTQIKTLASSTSGGASSAPVTPSTPVAGLMQSVSRTPSFGDLKQVRSSCYFFSVSLVCSLRMLRLSRMKVFDIR